MARLNHATRQRSERIIHSARAKRHETSRPGPPDHHRPKRQPRAHHVRGPGGRRHHACPHIEGSELNMALDTFEKLLKQANLLTPNEQLLLATRLIERVRQVEKPMTGKDLLNSGLVGIWAKRKDIGNSLTYARKLRMQAQTRRQSS